MSINYVFLCGLGGLRVYSRISGDIIFELPCGNQPFHLLKTSLSRAYRLGDQVLVPTAQGEQITPLHIKSFTLVPADRSYRIPDRFVQVHISPSGKDIIVAAPYGFIFYIPDFADSRGLEDRIRAVNIAVWATQVEFDGKRIVIRSVSLNLY